MKTLRRTWMLGILFLFLAHSVQAQAPQAPSPAPAPQAASTPQAPQAPQGDGGWPKTMKSGDTTLTLYQPQADSWSGNKLTGHLAVEKKGKTPTYGVAWFSAATDVQKDQRMVTIYNVAITGINFPSLKDRGAGIQAILKQKYRNSASTIALDRLLASLATSTGSAAIPTVAVKNEVPRFIVSRVPAMLVKVYGEPALKPVPGNQGGQRIANTPALIVTDGSKYFLYLADRWVEASSLDGSWTAATDAPPFLATALKSSQDRNDADLLPDPPQALKNDLGAGKVPAIYVSTMPTELIVLKGKPQLQDIRGTSLQWVSNTKSEVFYYKPARTWYVLVSGRWFTSPDMAGGWTYVPGKQLPRDFAKIPPHHERGAVLVSVPGTPEAMEALIATTIPQTAAIDRNQATFTARYDGGTPAFQPVAGTNLQYAANSPLPVIQVASNSFYAVKSGVWFKAPDPNGPWIVATSVPAAVYKIPPSCPVYRATYVKVYGSTPDVVYVGYTPGYYGTCVSQDATVVYGTGYTYPAYVGTEIVVAPADTYGTATCYVWGTATGFVEGVATDAYWAPGWGYGWGYLYGPCWGVASAAYWGSAWYYGPYGGAWSAASNVYGQWGNAYFHGNTASWANPWTGNSGSAYRGTTYNTRTGAYGAGTHWTNTNAYTGVTRSGTEGVRYNPNTGRVGAGQAGSVTNPYTGNSAAAARGANYNTRTGQTNTWSAAKVNDNVYATRDGHVYKNTGDGWQRYGSNGWSQPVSRPANSGYLDNQAAARSAASQRWGSFSESRSWGGGYGGGFRSGGSWGGCRGGGRRR